MKNTLYNPNDFYCLPKSFQSPRPMPFTQKSTQSSCSTPFSQRSRQELLSPQDLQGLPKPQMLEVLVDCLPRWLYLGLKHFGGYIFFILVLIMFVVVAGIVVFRQLVYVAICIAVYCLYNIATLGCFTTVPLNKHSNKHSLLRAFGDSKKESIYELKKLFPRCPRKTLLHWVSLAEEIPRGKAF